MPYEEGFQTAITYEILDSERQFRRVEGSIADFLAEIGGLYSLLVVAFGLIFKLTIGFDPADLFVTSELVASRSSSLVSKDKRAKQEMLKRSTTMHSKDEVQNFCCLLLHLRAMSCKSRLCSCCCRVKQKDRDF